MCYQYDQAAGKIAAGTNKGSKTRADWSLNFDTLELPSSSLELLKAHWKNAK